MHDNPDYLGKKQLIGYHFPESIAALVTPVVFCKNVIISRFSRKIPFIVNQQHNHHAHTETYPQNFRYEEFPTVSWREEAAVKCCSKLERV